LSFLALAPNQEVFSKGQQDGPHVLSSKKSEAANISNRVAPPQVGVTTTRTGRTGSVSPSIFLKFAGNSQFLNSLSFIFLFRRRFLSNGHQSLIFWLVFVFGDFHFSSFARKLLPIEVFQSAPHLISFCDEKQKMFEIDHLCTLESLCLWPFGHQESGAVFLWPLGNAQLGC